jgi:hypothetical protein
LAFATACTLSACRPAHVPVQSTVVPACPVVILAEPQRPQRPVVFLHYKIEEGKKWFALDQPGYLAIRDYVIQLEGSVDFAVGEIRESNGKQTGRNP